MSDPFSFTQTSDQVQAGGQMRLRKIGILSTAMFGGAAGLIFGLLAAVFLLLLGSFGGALQGGPQVDLAGAGVAAVVTPLIYGFMGFVGGAINAVVYNVVAGITGGIMLQLERDQ